MENNEEKKYPFVGVSAFIFNDKEELLLIRAPRWQRKYTVPGGKIEMGETVMQALARGIKEETNLEIKDINLLAVVDGVNLEGTNDNGYKHAIFLDYIAACVDQSAIKLNEEEEKFKWLPVEKWLEMKEDEFAPYIYEDLVRINGKKKEISLDYKYKRALADYQNLLKQTAKEKQELCMYANERFLHEILPVYGNLKMAMAHYGGKNHNLWLDGVKYVVKQFSDILTANGVEEIRTLGEKFSHNTMEAAENELTDDMSKDGIVAREIKAGYKLNGKVIMPARVIVYKVAA